MYYIYRPNNSRLVLYLVDPRYKASNFDQLKHNFTLLDNSKYGVNWISQRFLTVVISHQLENYHYLILSTQQTLEQVNPSNSFVVYINKIEYVNIAQTMVRLSLEVDDYYKINLNQISGWLSRCTLPDLTYKIEGKNLTFNANIWKLEDLTIVKNKITKLRSLDTYNENTQYFINNGNYYSYQQRGNKSLNNIIRKPLMIAYKDEITQNQDLIIKTSNLIVNGDYETLRSDEEIIGGYSLNNAEISPLFPRIKDSKVDQKIAELIKTNPYLFVWIDHDITNEPQTTSGDIRTYKTTTTTYKLIAIYAEKVERWTYRVDKNESDVGGVNKTLTYTDQLSVEDITTQKLELSDAELVNSYFANVDYSGFDSLDFNGTTSSELLTAITSKLTISNQQVITPTATYNWKDAIKNASINYRYKLTLSAWNNANPKLALSMQFSDYMIISSNANLSLDYMQLYQLRTNKISEVLCWFNYSELELPDAGYAVLSIKGIFKNQVIKYIKNDYITTNALNNYLNNNINSINFQRSGLNIAKERALQQANISAFSALFNGITSTLSSVAFTAAAINPISALGSLGSGVVNTGVNLYNTILTNNYSKQDAERAIMQYNANNEDLRSKNEVIQNLTGIDDYIINYKENDISLYWLTINEQDRANYNYYLNRFGWKVNDYITDLSLYNKREKYDYLQFATLNPILELSKESNEYLSALFQAGVWLVYDDLLNYESFHLVQP